MPLLHYFAVYHSVLLAINTWLVSFWHFLRVKLNQHPISHLFWEFQSEDESSDFLGPKPLRESSGSGTTTGASWRSPLRRTPTGG